MAKTEKRPAPIEAHLDRLDKALVYRYPHVTAPPGLALLCLGVAAAGHAWLMPQWAIPAGLALTVIVLLGLSGVFHGPLIEQVYSSALWALGGGWLALAGWHGPAWTVDGRPVLLIAWAGILAAGWPPWWFHRRVRRGIDVSREIAAFASPTDGVAVGLPGVRLSNAGVKADGHGWVAPVKIEQKGTYTLSKLNAQIPRIAARMGRCSPSELSFEAVHSGKEGSYRLRRDYGTRNPGGIGYQVPTAPVSIRKPFGVGKLADQDRPMLFEVWRKGHGGVDFLFVGAKGNGKTSAQLRVGAQVVAAPREAELIIADLKPGSPDYGTLAGGSLLYARTVEQIDMVVRILLVVCAVRGRTKVARRALAWIFDETSLYFGYTSGGSTRQEIAAATRATIDRQHRWQDLTSISRSADVAIIAALQRGAPQDVGGDTARNNIIAGGVGGFYAPKPRDTSLVIADNRIRLHELPTNRPGETWIRNGPHPDPERGRWEYISDAQVGQVVDRFRAEHVGFDADEIEALDAELGPQWRALLGGAGGAAASADDASARADDPTARRGSAPGTRAESAPAPRGPRAEPARGSAPERPVPNFGGGPDPRAERAVPVDASRQLVWDVLDGIGRPARVSEIAARAGRGPSIVRQRLAELADAGCVERAGENRFTTWTTTTRSPAELPAAAR